MRQGRQAPQQQQGGRVKRTWRPRPPPRKGAGVRRMLRRRREVQQPCKFFTRMQLSASAVRGGQACYTVSNS